MIAFFLSSCNLCQAFTVPLNLAYGKISNMEQRALCQGFTIVELLIVIVVIAILAAVVIVSYNGIQARARDSAAKQAINTVDSKLKAYKIENSDGAPATLAEIGFSDTSSVQYQYWRNTNVTPNTYCATATSGEYSYQVASEGEVVQGPCVSHTGRSPTSPQCATGYILVPGNSQFHTQAFCVMKYEAKDNSGSAVSVAAGTPWVGITQTSARSVAAAACTGCHLITKNEWLTIAHNAMSVNTNWVGGTIGSIWMVQGHDDLVPNNTLAASTDDSDGYFGTSDSAATNVAARQRRTLTLNNGQVIWDLGGNVWEFTDNVSDATTPPPGLASDVFNTFTYKEWTAPSVLAGGFASSFPAYGNPAATSWNSTLGLGQFISSSANTSGPLAVAMGGAHTTGYVNGGIFALRLNSGPETGSASTGFRVVAPAQ